MGSKHSARIRNVSNCLKGGARLKIKVYLNDWFYNAGIVGFLRILEENHDEFAIRRNNYIEFDTEDLRNFHKYYFNYFFKKYNVAEEKEEKNKDMEVKEETKEEVVEDEETSDVDIETNENSEAKVETNQEKIYIYVTGEVNIPGVVILNKGSRISDAINAAGGVTSNANTTKINLVYVLEDGMKVNVPSNDDLKKDSSFEYITKDSGEGAGDTNNLSADNGTSSNTKKERASSIVNINTATQTELETLPGIGPSTALKIINYRKENGKFSSIEDLKNVSGIGDNKFEALKKYITV